LGSESGCRAEAGGVIIASRSAPAKLNLTLEILGRRDDGYHELRSIVTTISLADELTVSPGAGFSIRASPDFHLERMALAPGEPNTVERALQLMRSVAPSDQSGPVRPDSRSSLGRIAISLTKRIPAAAGLGGGSSDAASALALLNDACDIGLSASAILGLAAQIGSDCPFFVRGGIQAMSGRGEALQPLPHPASAWFCIVSPSVYLPNKTAALYSRVTPSDFGDGSRTAALAARLQSNAGYQIQPEDLCNDFEVHAEEAFGSLSNIRSALEATGAEAVHLCGAGPSMYGLFADAHASEVAAQAFREQGIEAWSVSAPV
jgi:4-diphosphocytidyl-2-C-methyl-D-erythritol kinase